MVSVLCTLLYLGHTQFVGCVTFPILYLWTVLLFFFCRLNWGKSSLFPLDPHMREHIHTNSTLQVVDELEYLGVVVQLPINSYLDNNLDPSTLLKAKTRQ